MTANRKLSELESPWRSPAWRWYYGIEPPRSSRRTSGDVWIDLLRKFLEAKAKPRGKKRTNAADYSAIEQAHGIYSVADLKRAELEALLLTATTLNDIAARCEIPVRVVDTYANVFFHVRDRLDAADWIHTYAIGGGLHDQFGARRTETIWKYVAYTAGRIALNYAMAATLTDPLPPWLVEFLSRDPNSERNVLKCSIVIVAMTTNDAESLCELHAKLQELDGRVDSKTEKLLDLIESLSTAKISKSRQRNQGDRRPKAPRPTADQKQLLLPRPHPNRPSVPGIILQ